jgi:hypothetical protein
MRGLGIFLLLALARSVPVAAAARHGGAMLCCQSREFRDNDCPANTRGGVALVRQFSRNPCHAGETWGYDRRGIWVTAGCDAEFRLRGAQEPDPRYGQRGYTRQVAPPRGAYPPPCAYARRQGLGGIRVVCESSDYRYNHCPLPVRRDVDLVVQYSKAPCRYQATWGFDRGGVWVDRGCATEFVGY